MGRNAKLRAARRNKKVERGQALLSIKSAEELITRVARQILRESIEEIIGTSPESILIQGEGDLPSVMEEMTRRSGFPPDFINFVENTSVPAPAFLESSKDSLSDWVSGVKGAIPPEFARRLSLKITESERYEFESYAPSGVLEILGIAFPVAGWPHIMNAALAAFCDTTFYWVTGFDKDERKERVCDAVKILALAVCFYPYIEDWEPEGVAPYRSDEEIFEIASGTNIAGYDKA